MIPRRPQHCDQHPVYQRGCEDCRLISQKWERARARERAYRGPIRVPATQATMHVQRLVKEGMTVAAIGRAAGVSQTTAHHLANGNRATVHRNIHNRILGVTPQMAEQDEVMVPALGMSRRIQHLYFMGWSGAMIANRAGIEQSQVHRLAQGRQHTITREIRDAFMAAYQRIWDLDGGSNRAKATAARHGWRSIYVWDNPDMDRRPTAEARDKRRHGPMEELMELADLGATWSEETVRRAGFSSLASARSAARQRGLLGVVRRMEGKDAA